MTEGLNPGHVKVQRELQISIPSPDSERVMAIRRADWRRIESRFAGISKIQTDFSVLYGILFGLSGSAVLAAIPLAYTKDLPAWVLPTCIALAVGTFILGCFIVFFSRTQRKTRKTMMTSLLDDFKDVENSFTVDPIKNGEVINAKVSDT